MSMKLVAQCWELQLTHPQRAVLQALADSADDEGGNCYPGIPYLVWKTDYDERSIQRILRKLEALGYIETVRRASGPGSFTQYQLHFQRMPRKTPWRAVKGGTTPPIDPAKGGVVPPLAAARGGILSEKGRHSVRLGVTSRAARGDILSEETACLPPPDAGNAIRSVVNPVNDPLSDPGDHSVRAALLAELGTDSRQQVWWQETTRKLRGCWRSAVLVVSRAQRRATVVCLDAGALALAQASKAQERVVRDALHVEYGVLRLDLVTLEEWRQTARAVVSGSDAAAVAATD